MDLFNLWVLIFFPSILLVYLIFEGFKMDLSFAKRKHKGERVKWERENKEEGERKVNENFTFSIVHRVHRVLMCILNEN